MHRRSLPWKLHRKASPTGLDEAHEAAGTLINASLGMAVLVSVVDAAAMIAAGGCSAWLVYRYLGLKFASRSWFNLDAPGPSASFWSAPLRWRSAWPTSSKAAHGPSLLICPGRGVQGLERPGANEHATTCVASGIGERYREG